MRMAHITIAVCLTLAVLNSASCGNSYKTGTPLIKTVWGKGTHLEGPHWSPTENVLYFVDIVEQKIHRLDPETGNVTTRASGYGPVTPAVSVKDSVGLILVCIRTELFFLKWDSPPEEQSFRLLTALDLGMPDNRCNDGKVDAKGRFWIGTMGNEVEDVINPDKGSLYAVTESNYLHPEARLRPVSISNGLAWTRDDKFMFYIDTPTKNVDVFDFDLDTGIIRNRRTLFSFTKNNVTGFPDGMTIDSDGHLWIACYDGGKVIKVDFRSGKLMEEHPVPSSKVTSVMWGGLDLATLYVTSSQRGLTPAEKSRQPEAGSLFAIEGIGSRGVPEHQFLFNEANTY